MHGCAQNFDFCQKASGQKSHFFAPQKSRSIFFVKKIILAYLERKNEFICLGFKLRKYLRKQLFSKEMRQKRLLQFICTQFFATFYLQLREILIIQFNKTYLSLQIQISFCRSMNQRGYQPEGLCPLRVLLSSASSSSSSQILSPGKI